MRTLNLDEAADFLKLCRDEIRRRARLGLLPGAKAGRRWVFIERRDSLSYLRLLYAATGSRAGSSSFPSQSTNHGSLQARQHVVD